MAADTTRYFYRHELPRPNSPAGSERRFTVAYRYNPETGVVNYGASVFRKVSPNESFVKRAHRATAEGRLNTRPQKLNVSGSTFPEIENEIRDAIRTLGVGGDRI